MYHFKKKKIAHYEFDGNNTSQNRWNKAMFTDFGAGAYPSYHISTAHCWADHFV